jgi:hypothetical protein
MKRKPREEEGKRKRPGERSRHRRQNARKSKRKDVFAAA